ncbi:hypothetical protein FORC066_3656 [Yersinia enterocolitica]|nr:hypothetical protein FORC066_3656 [Yersinia enterocolitica]
MLGCYLADIKSVSRSFPSGCFYIYDILSILNPVFYLIY